MSMSTIIKGFRPPDEKWQKMKAVWDACEAAGTEIPDAVSDFFDGGNPDERGIEVELRDTPAVKEWSDGGDSGFEVEIAQLPKNVTHIRFYNSW